MARVPALSAEFTGRVGPALRGAWFEVVAHDGRPPRSLRVRGVVPGERVTVRPDPDDPPWGQVQRVLRASPSRREPPCRLADHCGGCHWLHIQEAAQRRLKAEAALVGLVDAGVPPERLGGIEIVPAPGELAYRHRARFQVATDSGTAPPRLGFHRPGSRDVLEVPACPLLSPPLAEAHAALRQALTVVGAPHDLTGLEITALPGAEGALLSVNPRDRAPDGWPGWGQRLLDAANGALAAVAVQRGRHASRPCRLGRSPQLGWTPAGRPVAAHPGTFVQSNLPAADRLVDAVLERARPHRGQRVLELFAGSGLLGWSLAAAGAHVDGLEADRDAVDAASLLPVPPRGRLCLRSGDAASLSGVATSPPPDVVVANPPRSGLGRAVRPLLEAAPPRIVEACCSLEGFAADAAALCRKGYRVSELAVYDLFPQTRHMELVATFERR